MEFFKPSPTAESTSPVLPPLEQAISSLRNHFSGFLQKFQPKPVARSHVFANVSKDNKVLHGVPSSSSAENAFFGTKKREISAEDIEKRLSGIPVFALSNASREFVLVSGNSTGKSLGLFCFSEADAEILLNQMKFSNPSMSLGSQVVPVDLSKVFQLKVDGVALRFLPEASQIRNALQSNIHLNFLLDCVLFIRIDPCTFFNFFIRAIRQENGIPDETFSGVPVFQSQRLILRSQDKRYRPMFFRKEDLEKSLLVAAGDQKQSNRVRRKGDIQVDVLENMIQGMKDGSVSMLDDVVFIPPGFDLSASSQQS